MKAKIIKQSLSVVAIATFTFFAVATGDKDKSSSATSVEESTKTAVQIGQVLQTDYFDVTVNEIAIKDRVSTGNQFADLKKEEGNKYLLINTTFKNTDKESRMLSEGTVWINYNGKDYEFDKSETVMLEGWGIMMEQLNPLTSITTNLVYKIPSEITGVAMYQPGRSDSDQKINLGELK